MKSRDLLKRAARLMRELFGRGVDFCGYRSRLPDGSIVWNCGLFEAECDDYGEPLGDVTVLAAADAPDMAAACDEALRRFFSCDDLPPQLSGLGSAEELELRLEVLEGGLP